MGGGLWDGIFIRLGFFKELFVSPKSPLVPAGIQVSQTRGIFKKFPSILKTRDPDDSSNTEDLHLIRVSAYLRQVTSHLLPLILIDFEF